MVSKGGHQQHCHLLVLYILQLTGLSGLLHVVLCLSSIGWVMDETELRQKHLDRHNSLLHLYVSTASNQIHKPTVCWHAQ